MELNKKKINVSYLYVLIVLDLTFSMMPYLPIFKIAGAFVLLGLMLPLLYGRNFFRTSMFVSILFYALIVFSNVMMGDNYFGTYMIAYREVYNLFIPISMFFIISNKADDMLVKYIAISFIVGLVYTILISSYIETISFGAIRGNAIVENQSDGVRNSGLYRLGLAKYSFVHAIPVLIPAFIMAFKNKNNKKKKRYFYGVLSLGCLYLTFLSQATAPLLVALLAFILSIVTNVSESTNINFRNVIIITLISLPFILSSDIQLSLLDFFDTLINHEGDFHIKVVEMQDAIRLENLDGTDVDTRSQLYRQSLSSGLSNILFGINSNNYGGHSALLDRFSVLGLIGLIPLIICAKDSFKFSIRKINPSTKIYYILGIGAGVLILIIKNSYSWEICLFMFAMLPILLIYLTPQDSNHNQMDL